MTIQEQINEDLKEAIKNRDEEKKSYLRVVIGEFSRIKAADGSKNHSDEVITKELRKLEENAKLMGNEYEQEVLSKYLPQKYNEEQITAIVLGIINLNKITSIKEMGKVMGLLKQDPKSSLIDNAIASRIIKETLK
jgi:uncharacterized protein YqeY